MTELKNLVRNAALRRLLMTRRPDHWQQCCADWQAWVTGRQAALPNPDLPRIYIAIPVQSIEDIPLYSGLLQLLQVPGLLPFVVLVLPNRVSARLAWTEAMLAGWAGLVTITTKAEWRVAANRLPASSQLVQFHFPAGFDDTKPGWKDRPALDGLPAATRPAGAVWAGRAGDWCVDEQFHSLPELGDHYAALAEVAMVRPKTLPEPRAGLQSAQAAEVLLRPSSLILPKVSADDLIAVTTTAEDGGSAVTTLQPASLSTSGSLPGPLPPRFATVAERQLDVHLLAPRSAVRHCVATIQAAPAAFQPWMLSAYLNRGGAGNPVVTAFARGAGCRLVYAEDELAEADALRSIPVVWGILRGSDEIVARAKAQGLHFYYIDHAYFDRGHGNSYRITRNGYEAGPVRKCADDRFKQLGVTIEPWRKTGRSIIVCPPTDFFAAAHGCENWLDETLARLRLETDRPIVIRAKPRAGEPFVPLREALQNAHALVTHSSNVAIEAACLGTPVFVSPTSAAAPIGLTDIGMIEAPRYPKRDGWLAHLAYSQFTLEEFASGEAWNIMQMHEDRDHV